MKLFKLSITACVATVALIIVAACSEDEGGDDAEPKPKPTSEGTESGGVATGSTTSGGSGSTGSTTSGGSGSTGGTNSDGGGSTGGSACLTRDVVFTHKPTDFESVYTIVPLPAFPGGVTIHNRHYIHVKESYDGILVPIYAPTAMTLYAASHYKPDGSPEDYVPEWALAFEASCDVQIDYAHIKVVSDKINAVYDFPVTASSATKLVTKVDFAAGEVIGWYKRGLNSIAWDMRVSNKRVTNSFANQSRFSNTVLLHAVSAQTMYQDAALKGQFDGLFGEPGSGAVVGATAGTVSIDVVGTAAGYWSLNADPASGIESENPPGSAYGSPMAIFLQTTGSVYLANANLADHSADVRTVNYVIASDSTFLDPKEITVGETHCYKANGGHAWLELVSATELRVFLSDADDCGAGFPASGYQTYFR